MTDELLDEATEVRMKLNRCKDYLKSIRTKINGDSREITLKWGNDYPQQIVLRRNEALPYLRKIEYDLMQVKNELTKKYKSL